MNEAEKEKIIAELEKLIKEFRTYKRLLQNEARSKNQDGYMYSLRSTLQRKVGTYRDLIVGLTGKEWTSELNYRFDFWTEALRADGLKSRTLNSIEACIQSINEAVGKLEATPLAELELQNVSVIQEPKDTYEVPSSLFDAMRLHPRVIEVSESLFKTGNYPSAIFEAFKAVHNYVQDKTGLTLEGVNLMEKVFNENKPILQLNELLTKSDRDEHKGFKYLFVGSQMGIRNPKAHENVQQEDPRRTLEYLSIASLLMRRIDESKLVKLNI